MKILEVMTQKVIAVKRSTSLFELIESFRSFHSFPLVPVTEENNNLVGTISFRNIMETFRSTSQKILITIPFVDKEELDLFDLEITPEMGTLCIVDDLMQTNFVSIKQDADIEEAHRLMQLHRQEQIPVVDEEGKLVGMIGMFDILLALFREKGVIK
ncbi:MAG: CBS domain-containing protein [Candidatus Omnitrophica bacterium]|nr:CBS domain-containing protein [Candidatus Omnitrophota bacterium]